MIQIPELTTEQQFMLAKARLALREMPREVLEDQFIRCYRLLMLKEGVLKSLIAEKARGELNAHH